jgi:hypothetical protein
VAVPPVAFGLAALLAEPRGGSTVITILIVLLVLMLVGSAPAWPYSRGWGYGPSGALGLIVLVLIILALSGRL